MKRIALAGIALAGVVWLTWPYYSAYSIGQAINGGDTVTLESRVSWPAVRQGIKDDFNIFFAQSAADDKTNPFAGLAAALAPALTSYMIDAFMTPSGFAALIGERNLKLAKQEISNQPNERGEKQKLRVGNVKYAFFTGPTSFLIVLGDSGGSDDTRLEIMMQFQDFGWKITRVYLPVKKMLEEQSASEASKKLSRLMLAEQITSEAEKKSAEAAANAEYIDKVKLYDFQARYITTYLKDRVPGVTFKLKNEGSKTLKRVEVTVYFKDRSDDIITEETLNGRLNKPLKPGYIWQPEDGKFYTAETVPSEWAEGRAEAKITSVQIGDE